jgi:hypothetical protein
MSDVCFSLKMEPNKSLIFFKAPYYGVAKTCKEVGVALCRILSRKFLFRKGIVSKILCQCI